MFWNNFERLCEIYHQTPKLVSECTGISVKRIMTWKKGVVPSKKSLKKIAKHFNVTTTELKNGLNIDNYKTDSKLYAIGYIDVLGTKSIHDLKGSDFLINILSNTYNTMYEATKTFNRLGVFKKIKLKIFSDNILIAIPTTEKNKIASCMSLIQFLSYVQYDFFRSSAILCRGGICVGKMHLDNVYVFGEGLIDAYNMESKFALTPRIIIDNHIATEIIKKHKFNKYICQDIDNKYYINYLVHLQGCDSNIIIPPFNYFIKNVLDETDKKVLVKYKWFYNYFEKAYKENKYIINIAESNKKILTEKFTSADNFMEIYNEFTKKCKTLNESEMNKVIQFIDSLD